MKPTSGREWNSHRLADLSTFCSWAELEHRHGRRCMAPTWIWRRPRLHWRLCRTASLTCSQLATNKFSLKQPIIWLVSNGLTKSCSLVVYGQKHKLIFQWIRNAVCSSLSMRDRAVEIATIIIISGWSVVLTFRITAHCLVLHLAVGLSI